MFQFYPWPLLFPAGMIALTMLAFTLPGDGLRDALDPKLRRQVMKELRMLILGYISDCLKKVI